MTAPVLCWDIDGTLLTTARAGVYALEKAIREFTNRPLNLQALATAGLTDVEIARLILAQQGLPVNRENERRFLRAYEDELPASLHRRQGHVMPGVEPILKALRSRPAWRSMLLTGNTRRGAQAKLAHYGLQEYFEGGAFSDDTDRRADIAKLALAQVRAANPDFPASHAVVIGDTAHDIACARVIGARCLAVATGGVDIATLREAHPDELVASLPAPAEFFALIERLLVRA